MKPFIPALGLLLAACQIQLPHLLDRAVTTSSPASGKSPARAPDERRSTRSAPAGATYDSPDQLLQKYCKTLREADKKALASLATIEAKPPMDALIDLKVILNDFRQRRGALTQQLEAEWRTNCQADVRASGDLYSQTNPNRYLSVTPESARLQVAVQGIFLRNALGPATQPSRPMLNDLGLTHDLSREACADNDVVALLKTYDSQAQQLKADAVDASRLMALSKGAAQDKEAASALQGKRINVNGFTVIKGGAQPVLKLEAAGLVNWKDCKETGRFDHFDQTGRARYEETCIRDGDHSLFMTVRLKSLGTLLPKAVDLKPGDNVWLRGRVADYQIRFKKTGNHLETAHAIDVDPAYFQEIDRAGKPLWAY